jgi:hypothetical protein
MDKIKSGFVYIWRDRKHNRYYVGSHWGFEDDNYICSSKWMNKSYKRRSNDFKRRILYRGINTRIELYEKEQQWLSLIKREEMKIRYYNLSLSVKNPWYQHPESRLTVGQKISTSKIGKNTGPRDPSVGQNISIAKKLASAKRLEETGNRLTNAQQNIRNLPSHNLGRIQPEDEKLRRAASNKEYYKTHMHHAIGTSLSEYHKRKIGHAHRGMKRSKETCQNIAKSNSKEYVITFVNNSILTVLGLKEYARETNIPYVTLSKAYLHQTGIAKYSIQSIFTK